MEYEYPKKKNDVEKQKSLRAFSSVFKMGEQFERKV